MPDPVTYHDGDTFPGVIGRTTEESSPAWPTPPRAREGAPNVIVFVLDDVGYGQLSSFGGLVETPVLDHLAASQHAHHGPVLAVAGLHPGRAQPSFGRDGHHRRDVQRLPRI
jgi:hypothetical protein